MAVPPSDLPSNGGARGAGSSHAQDVDGDAPGLPELIRQRAEFARDVDRIGAALATGAEDSTALYERLLRCRRISEKLENRIEVVRLQQRMRVGS